MQPWKKVLTGFLTAATMQPALAISLNKAYSLFVPKIQEVETNFLDPDELTETQQWLFYRLPESKELDKRRLKKDTQRGDLETITTETRDIINKNNDNLPEYLIPLSFNIDKLPKRVKQRYNKLTAEKYSSHLDRILDKVGQYQTIIEPLAEKYNIPAIILYAITLVESGANATVNDNGLMQITYIAAKRLNKQQDFINCYQRKNAAINLECGAMLLRYYFDAFTDRNLERETHWLSAIAAYNRGKNGLENDLKRARTTNPLKLKQSQTTAEAYMYTAKIAAIVEILKNTDFFD